MDPERVNSGLPQDHSGTRRDFVTALALPVDFRQSFYILGRRRGLTDRDAKSNANCTSTAADRDFRQLDHSHNTELWSTIKSRLRRIKIKRDIDCHLISSRLIRNCDSCVGNRLKISLAYCLWVYEVIEYSMDGNNGRQLVYKFV